MVFTAMPDDLLIEALTHNCVRCTKPLTSGHRVITAYYVSDLRSFSQQVELGLLGASARNFWVHIDCDNPKLKEGTWYMHPDIHHCIRCGNPLENKDVVNPVFQIVDSKAVNPNDPTDIGIAMSDRIYFLHSNCANPQLIRGSSLLITP